MQLTDNSVRMCCESVEVAAEKTTTEACYIAKNARVCACVYDMCKPERENPRKVKECGWEKNTAKIQHKSNNNNNTNTLKK